MKILRSFGFACSGLKYCITTQVNFRIHLLLASMALSVGFVLGISTAEWLAVSICIGLVLILEMVNTSIEKLCDMVQQYFHPRIKIIKDIAAGAVLVSALVSLCTGLLVFLPRIIYLIKNF